MLSPPHADVLNRRPVWGALSELFLDTNFDASDRDRIAGILAQSPYSVSDLEHILLWEVYPACGHNLFSIAGQWLEFDPEWLDSRILRGPSSVMRPLAATLGRVLVYSSLDWKAIKRGTAAKRGNDSKAT